MNDWIYALDIGTRKVAGLIGRRLARGTEVIALEVQEHGERSMLDGQVHDVRAVASVVRRITNDLENKIGQPIREATIAAAGRALRTTEGTACREISEGRLVDEEDLRVLERLAVEKALPIAEKGFHCVGYVPVAYRLDGVPMRSLLHQRGTKVEMDVLATFLPQLVMDGLLAVCHQAGLKVGSITLEPIAALEAVIPPDLRLLNLALVDVGAGTSDIAIVKEGNIRAFAMVPLAGDEVTETLCNHWVMDFHQAERLKRVCSDEREGHYKGEDIFGNPLEVPLSEARKSIKETVKHISRSIADRILELNGGAPATVVLVGGGSAVAGLSQQLGVDLNLENRRIGVRRPTQALNLDDRTGRLTEAWGVTPAGILMIAAQGKGLRLKQVFLNDTPCSVLQLKDSVTLEDLLRSRQWSFSGEPKTVTEASKGRDLRFTLNGQSRVVAGQPGWPASFRLDGKGVDRSGLLEEGARIQYQPARQGQDAFLTVADLQSEGKEIACFLNGLPITVKPKVAVDGRNAEPSERVPEGAGVTLTLSDRMRDVLESQGFEFGGEMSRQILVSINGDPLFLTQKNFKLTANGREVDFDYRVRQGDVLVFSRHVQSQYRVKDVLPIPRDGESFRFTVNGRPFTLRGEPGRIFMNGQIVSPDEFLIDHATIITREGRPAVGLVSHVLGQMDLPKNDRSHQRLRLVVDGQPAGFTTEVKNGSDVVIAFE